MLISVGIQEVLQFFVFIFTKNINVTSRRPCCQKYMCYVMLTDHKNAWIIFRQWLCLINSVNMVKMSADYPASYSTLRVS